MSSKGTSASQDTGGGTYSTKDDTDGTRVGDEEEKSLQYVQDKQAKAAKAAADKAAKAAKKKPPAKGSRGGGVPAISRAEQKDPAPVSKEDAMKAWKRSVMAALDKDKSAATEAKYLHDQDWENETPGSGPDAFADIVNGKLYKARPGNSDAERDAAGQKRVDTDELYHKNWWGTSAHKPKFLSKDLVGLMADPSWQPVTTVSRVMPDGTKASPDPYHDNFLVAARVNGVGKLTNPNNPNDYIIAPIGDVNPGSFGGSGGGQGNDGEMSHVASQHFPDGKAKIDILRDTLGTHTPGYLTNDEWKEAYGYMQKGWKINNRADLLVARAGGMKLLQGYWNLMHGADQRAVGYADTASTHQGGGYANQGSDRTFVGPEHAPVARVGDGTSDGQQLDSGALDFFVGGIPTSKRPELDLTGVDPKDKKAVDKAKSDYKTALKQWQDQQSAYNPFYKPDAPAAAAPAKAAKHGK